MIRKTVVPGRDQAWWIALAVPATLPFSNIATYVMGISAIGGMIIAVRNWREILTSSATRCLFLLFLCIWLPMIIALMDAVETAHSLKSTLTYLHFLPATLFLFWVIRDAEGSRRIQIWLTLLLALWSIDALFQYLAGFNLLGFPHDEKRVTGVFYPSHTLGIVLAAFAPLYFATIQTSIRDYGIAWLLVPLLIAAILLAGNRSAIPMLGIALLYAAWRLKYEVNRVSRHALAVKILIGFILIAAVAAGSHNHLQRFSINKFEKSMHPRVEMWRSAYEIWKDNWLNGIGVRGYRYVLPDYVSQGAGNRKIVSKKTGLGQTHPHLMLAEIGVETGVIGITGFILFWFVLIQYVRYLSPALLWGLMPCVVTLAVIMLPLNVHKAFYGNFYSIIIWWVIAVMLAATVPERLTNSGTSQ